MTKCRAGFSTGYFYQRQMVALVLVHLINELLKRTLANNIYYVTSFCVVDVFVLYGNVW